MSGCQYAPRAQLRCTVPKLKAPPLTSSLLCSTVPRPRQAFSTFGSGDPIARIKGSVQQPPGMDGFDPPRLPGDEPDAAVRNCVVGLLRSPILAAYDVGE